MATMSPQQYNGTPTRKRPEWLLPVVGAVFIVLAFIIGACTGAATDSITTPAETVTAPAPAASTVTAPASPQPTKTVTETKTKEVTPKSCLVALDHGETGFDIAADDLDISANVFEAILAGDYDEVEKQADKLAANNKKMERLAPKWNAAKAACRESG
jgi:hypothetical protein